MIERPILFSAPMVCAILDGSKTQTRRVMKPQPVHALYYSYKGTLYDAEHRMWCWKNVVVDNIVNWQSAELNAACPYGKVGDRLWVRETWQTLCDLDHIRPNELPHDADIQYPATYDGWVSKKRPSIHLPRAFSRITLQITDVRVELLKSISEADAWAEGVKGRGMTRYENEGRDLYQSLWEEINGTGSWNANPWVWVVSFERIKP